MAVFPLVAKVPAAEPSTSSHDEQCACGAEHDSLVWDRRFQWQPSSIIDGLRVRYRIGTLPEKALIRFEVDWGKPWGGLIEPLTFEPKKWFLEQPEGTLPFRHDVFRLAWLKHRLEVCKQLGLHRSVVYDKKVGHGLRLHPESPLYKRFGDFTKVVVIL
jgi:hypothetical protein